MTDKRLGTCISAAAISLMLAPAALAQGAANFYAGKTLNIVVGFTPGGGYDQYGRLLARHIGGNIPGAPTVVVQNAPGAGSLTAVRRLEANLPKDGTAIVTFNPALITESLTSSERVNVNFGEYGWIGSITRDFRVCYMWHATGVKDWAGVASRKEVIFGATSKGTGSYVNGAILRNLFDIKLRHVIGFPGSSEQRLAIERGELDGDCGSWSSIAEDWVRDKKINTFVSFSEIKTPDMPQDVPYIGDFAKTEDQKAILAILSAAGELGRPYLVSKEVPKDRVQILRAAFDATMKDKAFLADADKQKMPVYPISGAKAEEIVKRIYSFPPALIKAAGAASE
jgi:tripartite-type tricarboxylate transporter receptor subunit TctC